MGTVQDVTAAVLVVIAAGIVQDLGADHPALIGTVIAAIVLTSALTGTTLWLIGRLGLGQLVRFVPFPVIGGFLAGTGWLLLLGGVGLLAGGDVVLSDPTVWTDPAFLALILPGVGFGILLVVGTRRGAGSAFVPLTCVAAIVVFYAIVLLGPGICATRAGGWLLGPFPEGALWPPDTAVLRSVDVGAIAAQTVGIVTVVLLSAVALLLNVSGIELSTQQDADLDRELRVAGLSNLLSAAGGGLPGFHALSLSNLAHRGGATARTARFAAAGVVAVTLVLSGDIVARVPRPVVGGLLVFLGLAFLVEWLVDGWSRLSRTDYVVVVIVIVIAAVGFLEGVAVGIVITSLLFVVTYSRTDVVKRTIAGEVNPSQVDRSPAEAERLQELASAITVLELQGFLFFGTAHRLVEDIGKRLQRSDGRMSYVILDFRDVTGLDFVRGVQFPASRAARATSRGDDRAHGIAWPRRRAGRA